MADAGASVTDGAVKKTPDMQAWRQTRGSRGEYTLWFLGPQVWVAEVDLVRVVVEGPVDSCQSGEGGGVVVRGW